MNYKENTFTFSMYEMWQQAENDTVFNILYPFPHLEPNGIAKDKSLQYTFKYLYK